MDRSMSAGSTLPLGLLLSLATLLSGAWAFGGARNHELPEDTGPVTVLGIPLPDGFESTRDASEQVHLLQTMCMNSYRGLDVQDRPATPGAVVERFAFGHVPSAPEETMATVTTLLVDSGYRVRYVFDQFLEDLGVVVVIVFSPSGDEGYYLLFDYERRLFHPVGPCPTRSPTEQPEAP